ncbi:MAG: flagellin [Eubacteriaceae bacterium]|nr:flagellin [Eubacteriaceae bacterium]
MRINHNISALNTYNKLSSNTAATSKSLEKLSSGLKINRAGDNAAGLAISEKMRGQIRGLDQASTNASDGISLIQTAEGALNETHSILQRMRELAVQSANDTNTDDDRAEIQKEVEQLKSEITRISTDTEFNTKKLLNGDMGKVFTPSVTSATLTNLQATGSDLGNGTYSLTLTNAGTDTTSLINTSLNAGFVVGDIAVDAAAQIDYGAYRLEVTNYNAVGSTGDLTLTGPNGEVTTRTGVDMTAAVDNLGGLDLALNTNNITQNGVMNFNLTSNGLDVDLSGEKTANTAAITAYAGEKLNVGGFEFTVKTNHGADTNLVTGTLVDKAVKFQIGANEDQNTSLAINDMGTTALGLAGIDLSTQTGANSAITTIDNAISSVSSERAKLGAVQNRLDHTINNLGTSSENLSTAESRIRDVDMAKEMMEFTKNNILSQAAQSMLAQANQQPQGVLQLLQ